MLDLSAATPDQISAARGVSHDGQVVAGTAISASAPTTFRAFRWTPGGGMTDLGGLVPGGFAQAFDVSLDGEVIVGQAASATLVGNGHAFRWTESDGMVDLGGFGGISDFRTSAAMATDGDGSVVVGHASLGGVFHAFRWEAGVMADIGTLSGDTQAMATSVSADGNVVVGISSTGFITPTFLGIQYGDASRAFRWTAATDIQDLNALAAAAGVAMAGIRLISAIDVSADGTLIAGAAFTPASPAERTAYVLRYEDATTGAAAVDAGFVDLSLAPDATIADPPSPPVVDPPSPPEDEPLFPPGDLVLDTFCEAGAGASLSAAAGALVSAAARNSLTAALVLDRYGSWATPDEAGMSLFTTSGGFGSGIRGFAPLTDDLSLLAGVAFAAPAFDEVGFGNQTLGAIALRHDLTDLLPTGTGTTGYVEIAASTGRIDDLTLTRPYETGIGVGIGPGATSGETSSVDLRGAILSEIGASDVLGLAAVIGRQWLSTDAFPEPATTGNPFPASYAALDWTWAVAALQAQWVHALSPAMDLTLTAGWNHTFGTDDALTASFTGIGPVTGTAPGDIDWIDLGVFVGGVFGNDDIAGQTFGSLSATLWF